MKSFSLFLIILFVAATQVLTGQNHPFKHEQTISKVLEFKNPNGKNTFELHNISGHIEVEGYIGKNVQIEISKNIIAKTNKGLEEMKMNTEIVHKISSDKILLYVDSPNWKFNTNSMKYKDMDESNTFPKKANFNYHFKIKVPKNVNINISNFSGHFSLSDMDNEAVKVKVTSGHIQLEDIRSKTVDTYTQSGHNNYQNVIAQKINVMSYSGILNLDRITGTTQAETYSGDINIGYLNNPTNDSSYQTYSGSIRINFKQHLNATIDYSINHGKFHGYYSKKDTYGLQEDVFYFSKHQNMDQSGRVQVNNGDLKIKMKTYSGNIYFDKN